LRFAYIGPVKAKDAAMTLDRAVLMFAGFVVLISLALGVYVSPWWHLLTAFAGLNMIQAAVTGFCPAALVFKALGIRAGCAFQ
jgi:hypothetical protein